jgi:MurNAc alpha-1-phosphate uridylyltransferase
MPNALILFAAGFGTRMGALTQTQPKPLIKVAGRALLDHALDLAAPLALGPVVVNTHYLGEKIAAHLANRPEVQISHEAPDILETGGGLRQALPLLGPGPVFAMNTDAIWRGPNPLLLARHHWNPDKMDALLVMLPRQNAIGHTGQGDFLANDAGQLQRGPGLVYSGVQIINPVGISDIADAAFSLNILWDQMIARGRLFGVTYGGEWCDVGSPSGIAQAEALLAQQPHATGGGDD